MIGELVIDEGGHPVDEDITRRIDGDHERRRGVGVSGGPLVHARLHLEPAGRLSRAVRSQRRKKPARAAAPATGREEQDGAFAQRVGEIVGRQIDGIRD